MRPPHAVYDLGHMLNEWREHGRDVRACEVCGGRWENAAVLRECPGGPPPGAEIRSVRCRHCKVEAVILKVRYLGGHLPVLPGSQRHGRSVGY